ncbi:hypothetical protein [Chitinophaga ginsengisoli]|uniref:Uncharacterized protein n=1 Tax=Chitinophaga ginsengisoli TaxID=363837 RepID=A0A2P8FM55_9BACT|nr:hypothetical protein [Chitinophaga ginsengisoli]PSL22800.1 hypothetical protein CLV42_12061 [Chitinophaga ginsengisoli]
MRSRDNDIANELREIIPDAQWTTLNPSFGGVPAGYFEQLPGQILQKVHTAEVQEELETLSPLLAGVPKSLPLSVPPGYFEQLSQQILQNITAAQQTLPDEATSSFLADMPKVFPMSAPAGYFDQLSAVVMARIAETEGTTTAPSATAVQEELATLSPLLAGIPKTMPLSVPAGYFDQLSTAVMADINHVSAPVHAPIIRRMNTRRYMGWAVAACLVALVSVSTLFFIKSNYRGANMMEKTLASVSDQEIMEYLQSHTDVFDKEELSSNTPLVEENNAIPGVEELPAEAIQHYLDNTGLLNESITDN